MPHAELQTKPNSPEAAAKRSDGTARLRSATQGSPASRRREAASRDVAATSS